MAYRMQPIVPVYDIQGNFAGTRAPGTGNAVNPVAQLYHAKDNDGKYFRVLGNIFGEATILKPLRVCLDTIMDSGMPKTIPCQPTKPLSLIKLLV